MRGGLEGVTPGLLAMYGWLLFVPGRLGLRPPRVPGRLKPPCVPGRLKPPCVPGRLMRGARLAAVPGRLTSPCSACASVWGGVLACAVCGVVWCGVVWSGVVWSGVVWTCGVGGEVWCGVSWAAFSIACMRICTSTRY